MNNLSLKRSAELTNMVQDFTTFKQEYLQSNKDIVKNNKQKLLKALHATEADWDDWHWQLDNRIHTADKLQELLNLDPAFLSEIKEVSKQYTWSVTPYYLSLIAHPDRNNPIVLQAIPRIEETDPWGCKDPMAEMNHNPAGAITRRYPDRAIVNLTNNCAMYCRHCQRKRNISEQILSISPDMLQESLDYIREHPEIRDVLLTGGDPLTMEDDMLENIVAQVREIPTVEIIRLGTRTPVTLPQRITDDLVNRLKPYAPIFINTQFNHPDEVTLEAKAACGKLADNGFPLGNQMVFLKGVNNDAYTLRLLNQLLLSMRVRPYYIFHPKEVAGTKHFHISVTEGLKLHESLRGNTSGLAIPSYVVNAPGGLGKVSIQTEKVRIIDDDTVELETWEGRKVIVS